MPDILIRGMEMPQCGERRIVIRADGSVHDDGDSEIHWSAFQPTAKAVELPEHGDLIDRNKLIDALILLAKHENNWRRSVIIGMMDAIGQAPVIVPPNKEETE